MLLEMSNIPVAQGLGTGAGWGSVLPWGGQGEPLLAGQQQGQAQGHHGH